MSMADSFDKIVTAYFAGVTAKPFAYKGITYFPKPLRVSSHFFHDYTCVSGCAGCCPRFSLDYLPSEQRPGLPHMRRLVHINGRTILLYSKIQKPQPDKHFCDNVNMENGQCGIHGRQPFSCDFETLRFVHSSDHTWLGTRPFGRGWNMLRVDGQRGAKCLFPKTETPGARDEAIRKLLRLEEWATYAGLQTYIPAVVKWARTLSSSPQEFSVDSEGRIVSKYI